MFIPVGEKKGEKALLPESVGCAREAELRGATIFRGTREVDERWTAGVEVGSRPLASALRPSEGDGTERLKRNKHVFVRLRALRQGKVCCWAALRAYSVLSSKKPSLENGWGLAAFHQFTLATTVARWRGQIFALLLVRV